VTDECVQKIVVSNGWITQVGNGMGTMFGDKDEKLTTEQKEFRRKWVVFFSAMESLAQFGIKLGAAVLTGSAGLLADSIHSLADVAGSLVVWVGVRIAPHKYRRFPYGFFKIENLLALGIGIAILYGAWEIFQVFLAGEAELPTNIPLGIAAVIFAMVMDYFWGSFEAKSGRLINSPGIEASGKHTISDVYSSLVVMAGLVGSWLGLNVDRWAALLVGILVAKVGLEILWDNLKILLDISLSPERLQKYSRIVARQRGVRTVNAVRGRSAGSFRFVDVDVGVIPQDLHSAHDVATAIERALQEHDDTIDSVFVRYANALPNEIIIFVPVGPNKTEVGDEFGQARQFAVVRYDRKARIVREMWFVANPHPEVEHHRGIMLADFLIDQDADSVCCREDLGDKGPGLMFHRFGVDVRTTTETELDSLLADYFGKSRSVFPGAPDGSKQE
jgi:cation diffusion facilitator family transporter